MGNPLSVGAIKTIRTNVVGSGLKLNANIDADFLGMTQEEARAWEKHVERQVRLWADLQIVMHQECVLLDNCNHWSKYLR